MYIFYTQITQINTIKRFYYFTFKYIKILKRDLLLKTMINGQTFVGTCISKRYQC